jgi:hypothetical protein
LKNKGESDEKRAIVLLAESTHEFVCPVIDNPDCTATQNVLVFEKDEPADTLLEEYQPKTSWADMCDSSDDESDGVPDLYEGNDNSSEEDLDVFPSYTMETMTHRKKTGMIGTMTRIRSRRKKNTVWLQAQ